MTKAIFIRTSFASFNQWPEAPPQVAFLRNLHRHKFNVEVRFSVTEDDRQLEFFMTQAAVNKVLFEKVIPALEKKRTMSCEMLAGLLFSLLEGLRLPVISVSIDEDGENGAIVSA